MEENPLALARLAAANHWLRDEVERLRLTDEEREAVEAAVGIIDRYEEDMDGFPSGAAATLRGLLERAK